MSLLMIGSSVVDVTGAPPERLFWLLSVDTGGLTSVTTEVTGLKVIVVVEPTAFIKGCMLDIIAALEACIKCDARCLTLGLMTSWSSTSTLPVDDGGTMTSRVDIAVIIEATRFSLDRSYKGFLLFSSASVAAAAATVASKILMEAVPSVAVVARCGGGGRLGKTTSRLCVCSLSSLSVTILI